MKVEGTGLTVHVLPVDDLVDHSSEGVDCWCQPTYLVDCSCDNGCDLCEGTGMVPVEKIRAWLAQSLKEPLVVSHNAADGRE